MAEVDFNQQQQQPQQNVEAMIQEKAMRFERPIPGQSLTQDPDSPMPYEKPPQYTDRNEALEYFFAKFVEEDTYPKIMELISTPFPIMDIVKIFLIEAFEEGVINPDMIMLLAEPLAYMLMALAERADIDFIIERAEEGEEDEEESEQQSLGVLDNALGRMDTVQKDEDFPEDIEQRIQQQEAPQSLLGAR